MGNNDADKPGDVSLIPRTHMKVEVKSSIYKLSSDFHVCSVCVCVGQMSGAVYLFIFKVSHWFLELA